MYSRMHYFIKGITTKHVRQGCVIISCVCVTVYRLSLHYRNNGCLNRCPWDTNLAAKVLKFNSSRMLCPVFCEMVAEIPVLRNNGNYLYHSTKRNISEVRNFQQNR